MLSTSSEYSIFAQISLVYALLQEKRREENKKKNTKKQHIHHEHAHYPQQLENQFLALCIRARLLKSALTIGKRRYRKRKTEIKARKLAVRTPYEVTLSTDWMVFARTTEATSTTLGREERIGSSDCWRVNMRRFFEMRYGVVERRRRLNNGMVWAQKGGRYNDIRSGLQNKR